VRSLTSPGPISTPGQFAFWRPKVRNESIIHMTARVYSVLSRKSPVCSGDYVFRDKAGGPRGYAAVSMRKALNRAGLTDCTIHTLRHTHATRPIQNGLSVYEVQSVLGHTDIKTTLRYADLEQARVTARAMKPAATKEAPRGGFSGDNRTWPIRGCCTQRNAGKDVPPLACRWLGIISELSGFVQCSSLTPLDHTKQTFPTQGSAERCDEMGRYYLNFFGHAGSLEATLTLNSISDDNAYQVATTMLSNTTYSFVEIFDNRNILYLLGRAAERMSA
jgi:hypothetical protein